MEYYEEKMYNAFNRLWNTGWFYDIGIYIAIISGFGGLSLSRKKKTKGKD